VELNAVAELVTVEMELTASLSMKDKTVLVIVIMIGFRCVALSIRPVTLTMRKSHNVVLACSDSNQWTENVFQSILSAIVLIQRRMIVIRTLNVLMFVLDVISVPVRLATSAMECIVMMLMNVLFLDYVTFMLIARTQMEVTNVIVEKDLLETDLNVFQQVNLITVELTLKSVITMQDVNPMVLVVV